MYLYIKFIEVMGVRSLNRLPIKVFINKDLGYLDVQIYYPSMVFVNQLVIETLKIQGL